MGSGNPKILEVQKLAPFGPVCEWEKGKYVRLCDKNFISFYKEAGKVIFITQRGSLDSTENNKIVLETVLQLKALGIHDPVVWCTAKRPKGPYILERLRREKNEKFDGGRIVFVDDCQENLDTFTESSVSAENLQLFQRIKERMVCVLFDMYS